VTSTTPAALGYRMPAEWHAQDAVWLAWPHNPETWVGDALPAARDCYVRIIRALAADQRVCVLVGDEDAGLAATRLMKAGGVELARVSTVCLPTADTWIRDYGPTFLIGSESNGLAAVSWRFNAWGGKYADLAEDDRVAALLCERIAVPVFDAPFVLEGGSIDVNGEGAVLTTEQCLLDPNRNPRLSRREIETHLGEYLGIASVIWLGEGIVGDDTDGHVDDIARFVAPDTVVCALEEDPTDANYEFLEDNYRRLQTWGDPAGRSLRVIPLPMPRAVVEGGTRLPASYANFYIGNTVVVAPVFDDPADTPALEILAKCFPARRVVGVDCRSLVVGLGAIHCSTQQQPAPERD
jgi:agmatine deiminase